jgi:GxxExxY protein
VIGAAIEVHRKLGPGYQESVYEEALCIELSLRGIPFSRQHEVSVAYKGRQVGAGKVDLLVDDSLIVERKAVESLLPGHTGQVLSYLKASDLRLGLLLNFGAPVMEDGIRRVAL